MIIKDTLYKTRILIQLFTNLKYRYRVEIEDYHPDTWYADVLHLKFFHTFSDAQGFIKNYKNPFYLIRLFEQDDKSKVGFSLCNIETGQRAGVEIENYFDYERDEFGYDLPVRLSAGWYERGEIVHHPVWVSVVKDLGRIEKEVRYRYTHRNSIFYFLQNAVNDVFSERHPNAPKHFRKKFIMMLVDKMDKAGELDVKSK